MVSQVVGRKPASTMETISIRSINKTLMRTMVFNNAPVDITRRSQMKVTKREVDKVLESIFIIMAVGTSILLPAVIVIAMINSLK